MDLAHLHLMLTHVPVIGVVFGLLAVVWGIVRRSDEVKIIGLVALVLTAIAAVAVYLTGGPAEEIVEKLPGVSENIIKLHEDSALISLILAIVAGAMALLALISRQFRSPQFAQFAIMGTLLISLATGIFMARTANLGGQIRHSEIRSGIQNGATEQPQRSQQSKRDDDDDR